MTRLESRREVIAVLLCLYAAVACGVPLWDNTRQGPLSPPTPTPLGTPWPTETSFPTASPTLLPTVAGTAAAALATPTEIVVSNDLPGVPALAIAPPPPPTTANVLITNTAPVVVEIHVFGHEIFLDPGETQSLALPPGAYAYEVAAEGYQTFTGFQDFPAGYWTWVLNAAP